MPKSQHDRIYSPIPALLRAMRRAGGITQVELAAKIGKTQNWIWKSETGMRRIDPAEFALFVHGCGGNPADAFQEVAKHAIACGSKKTKKIR